MNVKESYTFADAMAAAYFVRELKNDGYSVESRDLPNGDVQVTWWRTY